MRVVMDDDVGGGGGDSEVNFSILLGLGFLIFIFGFYEFSWVILLICRRYVGFYLFFLLFL